MLADYVTGWVVGNILFAAALVGFCWLHDVWALRRRRRSRP